MGSEMCIRDSDESTQLGAGIYAAIFVFLDFLNFMSSGRRRKREMGQISNGKMGRKKSLKNFDEREGETSGHVPGLRDEVLIG